MAVQKFPYKIVKSNNLDKLKSQIRSLMEEISSARNFIKEIENGNLSIEFQNRLGDSAAEQALGDSLISMRDQMRKIAEEERQRNWITEGLAQFMDILRSSNDDLKSLSHIIISNVIKYLHANQGSLYILDDSDKDNACLDMIACYAYDRKKHVSKRIGIGEGLVGQCVLEKSPIYMTNLPGDYLKITSGLGAALPKNLLIVPLIVNDRVYGVMEMASFNIFEPHHREFVEKVGESIASTIANVRINEQTKQLLAETQTQAEMMRAQEEEMRQNMEELTATQEEMQRVLRDVEKKEKYLNQLLNVSTDSIFTIDREYKLVSWNKAFAKTLEQYGMSLQKGMNTLDWYSGEERTKQVAIYNRVLSGESFDFTASAEQNGKTAYHLSIYAPLRNENNEVVEAAIFAKDVSAMMNAQRELQAQEEELRQNMEELKATQEEMTKTEIAMAGQLAAINNSMATIEFTMDGTVINANERFCQFTGYSLDEVKGKHHRFFLYQEEYESAAYKEFWRALNSGVAQNGEFRRTVKNGREVWISASYTVVKDSHGNPLKVIKFAMDITEQKLKAVDYEGQIDAIRRSNAVIEFDMKGNIIYANQLFLSAMGYDEAVDVLNRHHSIFISEFEARSSEYKRFWERLQRGEFFTGEFQRKKANGETIWIYGSYNPIVNADGKPYKVVKYAHVVNKNAQAVTTRSSVPAL
ncbi:MAG TPA: PAS domain S-box protein [Chryseosolibacter sp.]